MSRVSFGTCYVSSDTLSASPWREVHHCLCCLIPVIVEIAEVAGVGDLTTDLACTVHTAQHGTARGNASKIHSR